MEAICQLTCLAARLPSHPARSPCPPLLPHHCCSEGCPGLPGSQFLCSLPGQAMVNLGWGQASPQLQALVSSALGILHPHDSGCQIPNPTGEEFKTTPKPNKNQVRLDLSFSCNLMSATAQFGNMSRPPSKKSDFEQKAGNHGLSDSSVQIHWTE